ncbi:MULTISPECIES: hypothetical protein [unclassified Sphingomonas]|uniref:hypothetical protein n=1 Tax=unclassified Sphingomonas TaxID=196159 RepID=UPI0006F262FB|nr:MULTISPECIES: hypothetical protein [unclassified Sphingomonas]KQM26722.1 hypothetical protein ASE58_13620 [Sphingomonas sp. Leaf9]KQM43127.1 hypothetical protein ASE57_13625 [Sphingomonas sp. Leaf11]
MTARPRPSFQRRATALTIAAFAAVAEISVISLGYEMLQRLVYRGEYEIDAFVTFLTLYLIFGAIIAVPLCLAIGLPLWYLAMRTARERRSDAVRFGLAAGAIIGWIISFLSTDGTQASVTFDILLLFLLFCGAGISTGWIAHRLGYPRP